MAGDVEDPDTGESLGQLEMVCGVGKAKHIQEKMKELQTQYDFDSSELVVDHDDGLKGIMQKAVVGEPTLVEFEGHQLYGVANPHTYLSNKYGDYMVIPSQNRQRQHNFHYLDFDKSYKTYPHQ